MNIEKVCENRIKEVCKQYNVPVTSIVFSGRLKAANGTYQYSFNRAYRNKATTPEIIKKAITEHIITISKALISFGEKAVLETVNHELAHHIEVFKSLNIKHTYSFKKLCVELGGTMNAELAGSNKTFQKAIGKNWVSKTVGTTYECKCGKPGHGYMEYSTKPREASLDNFYCPTCETKMRHWRIS